ncbi:MAG: NAD-dependent epimerase/dehydratase family protein, partial [Bacteroidia bacterium]|nr:NAD-dependent epimerase/dehydratase family protein [Bacteroidia bacterium]
MSKLTVAVFGGSGFLGTYIVSELLKKGYVVWVLDKNKSDCIPDEIYKEVDILSQLQVQDFFKNHAIDYVYNLAGFASLDKAIHFPIEAFNLNV